MGKLEAQEKAGKLSEEGEARLKTARVLKDLSPSTVVRLQRMGVSIDPERSVQIASVKPKKLGTAGIKVEKGTRFVKGVERRMLREGEVEREEYLRVSPKLVPLSAKELAELKRQSE